MEKPQYVPVHLDRRRRYNWHRGENRRNDAAFDNSLQAERLIRSFTSVHFCVPYVEFTAERLYSVNIPTTELSNKAIQTIWPTNPEYLGEHGRLRPEMSIAREVRNAKEA